MDQWRATDGLQCILISPGNHDADHHHHHHHEEYDNDDDYDDDGVQLMQFISDAYTLKSPSNAHHQ